MHIYSVHESSSFAWIFLVCLAAIMQGAGNTDVANAILNHEINERRATEKQMGTDKCKWDANIVLL